MGLGLMDLGIEGDGGFGFCSGFGFRFRRWWVSALMVGGLGLFCRHEAWWESGKKKKTNYGGKVEKKETNCFIIF